MAATAGCCFGRYNRMYAEHRVRAVPKPRGPPRPGTGSPREIEVGRSEVYLPTSIPRGAVDHLGRPRPRDLEVGDPTSAGPTSRPRGSPQLRCRGDPRGLEVGLRRGAEGV